MKYLLSLLLLVTPLMAQPSPRTVYVTHKTAHALVGLTVAYTFAELGYPKTGVVTAWLLGVLKELYDQRHGGSFRAGDVAWTGAPATVFTVSFRW